MTVVNQSHINRGNFNHMFHFTQYVDYRNEEESEQNSVEEEMQMKEERNRNRLQIFRENQVKVEKERIQLLGEKL